MKLTKRYHFLKPDLRDNFDIKNQNYNWSRLDDILSMEKKRVVIQTIIQLLAIIILFHDRKAIFEESGELDEN